MGLIEALLKWSHLVCSITNKGLRKEVQRVHHISEGEYGITKMGYYIRTKFTEQLIRVNKILDDIFEVACLKNPGNSGTKSQKSFR